MKFYVLKHPTKGYLSSNKWSSGSWPENVKKSKMWSSSGHVRSLLTQTTRENRRECIIIQVEFNYEPILTEIN